MEEKERYKIYKDNRGNAYICDTSKNVDYKTYQEFVNLLNQQDKHTKELEEENKECKRWENMFHKLSTEEDNAITKVNKSLSNPMTLIDNYDKWADYTIEQIKQSQKQLTEKERQLKLAKELLIKQEKEYDEQLEKQAKIHYKHLKEKDQDKISFALEPLEKVKELLNTDFESTISWIDPYEDGEYLNSMTYNHNNTIKIIDNQIASLKKGVE